VLSTKDNSKQAGKPSKSGKKPKIVTENCRKQLPFIPTPSDPDRERRSSGSTLESLAVVMPAKNTPGEATGIDGLQFDTSISSVSTSQQQASPAAVLAGDCSEDLNNVIKSLSDVSKFDKSNDRLID
jgi:hypothetical protein